MADDNGKKNLALREIVRDPSLLAQKRKELDNLRSDLNKDWEQNKAFYNGHQWVFFNTGSGQVESLGVDDGDKPRYKVRLTENQVTPGVTTLIAQMTKTRPTIRAVPDSGADRDVKAAQMAERLYEFWWDEFSLKSKLQSALVHAQLSQGYWLITWDPMAGKPFKVMRSPEDGKPITDQQKADIFREEITAVAEQQGMDPAMILSQVEQTLYLGDVKVQPLGGDQVWLDPVATNWEDAAYAICKYPMDVDDIEARFGVRVEPDAQIGDSKPQLWYTRQKDQRAKTARDVFVIYAKPSPSMPKGRVAVWIEGPNKILEESNWEFPTNELPLVKFPGIERPNSVYDEARVTLVRPLQKELNQTISKVAMHKNLTMKPQMIAPIGSVQQQLTDEPGLVVQFAPIQGIVPQWRPIPGLPSYVFEYVNEIRAQIGRIFNQMPSERSQLPPRTDSGSLLDLMQEAVADQISPEIQRMEISLARAGKLMAALAKKYYIEPRLLRIYGPGGSVQSKRFINSDLEGGYSFQAEAGSGLPRTRAGQTAQIKELIEMQVLSPQDALPYLPIAGLKAVQSKLASDEDFAHRKIEKLIKGEPLNPIAMQQALAAVQSGVNPTTGFPWQSQEEVVAFVQQAALSPQSFENWNTSLKVLQDHMTSVEFEAYPPETQQRFLQHFDSLRQMVLSLPQGSDVKVTLGLNGTVGPTVAAEILRDKGIIGATPEKMAEPPLETSVYDSVDKPDADDAGNDPLTQAEQLQNMMHAADQHTMAQAKAAHHVAQADHATESSQFDTAMKMDAHARDQQRKDELHAERVRQMRQPKPDKAASSGR